MPYSAEAMISPDSEPSLTQNCSHDIDVTLIHGYGYPVWRGGPMFEADAIGLDQMLKDIEETHAFAGADDEPAPLIQKLARDKRRFADLAPGEAAL